MMLEFSRGGKTILTPLPLLPNFRRKEPTMSNNQNGLILLQDLGMIYETPTSIKKRRAGLFKCSFCGNEFKTRMENINNPNVKSCGCHKKNIVRETHLKHGMYKHELYKTWLGIINRVSSKQKDLKKKKNYYDRGITICERWLDVRNFIEDMYPTYQEGLTIDRIDVNGNYEPSNCRWANQTIQSRNTRLLSVRNITGYRGITQTPAKRWKAGITINSSYVYLGTYDTKIEAAKVYDKYVIDNNLEHPINNA